MNVPFAVINSIALVNSRGFMFLLTLVRLQQTKDTVGSIFPPSYLHVSCEALVFDLLSMSILFMHCLNYNFFICWSSCYDLSAINFITSNHPVLLPHNRQEHILN